MTPPNGKRSARRLKLSTETELLRRGVVVVAEEEVGHIWIIEAKGNVCVAVLRQDVRLDGWNREPSLY